LSEHLLQPTVDVEYVVKKKDKVVLRFTEDWNGLDESGQRIVLSRFLKTETLEKGEYELLVHIRDKKTDRRITQTARFKIVDEKK